MYALIATHVVLRALVMDSGGEGKPTFRQWNTGTETNLNLAVPMMSETTFQQYGL